MVEEVVVTAGVGVVEYTEVGRVDGEVMETVVGRVVGEDVGGGGTGTVKESGVNEASGIAIAAGLEGSPGGRYVVARSAVADGGWCVGCVDDRSVGGGSVGMSGVVEGG